MTAGRVLVVDHHPADRMLAGATLGLAEFQVRTAADTTTALAELEAFAPGLMLVDLNLPWIDGIQLTQRLRQGSRWSALWIVASTADSLPGIEDAALRAGCDAYIPKPIEVDRLVQLVSALLGGPGRARKYSS